MTRPQPSSEDLAAEYERVSALGDAVLVEAELARLERHSPEFGAALRRRFELLAELRAAAAASVGGAKRLLASVLEPAGSTDLRDELLTEIESDTAGLSPALIELEALARGGMSEIVRVWDPALKRELALKRLAPHGDAEREPTATQVRRFIDEARITGTLEHPSIVPVHHFGLDPRGRLYFTMQRVPGPTLAEVIELCGRRDATWTLPRVVRALLAVCEAVAFAHDQGVIHRDIKPSNIKVGRFGEIYLLDWGVARRLDAADIDAADIDAVDIDVVVMGAVNAPTPDAAAGDLERDDGLRTASGVIVGTPAFMAPEQALEVSPPHPRTDVYSLGAVLYQVLSGEPPYGSDGNDASKTLERLLEGPPPSLLERAPHADAELVSICERAMAREPSVRYADARDLAQDLHAWLDGRVVRAHASGALAEFGKWTRRNRLAAASLAAVIVISLSVALWMTRSNEQLRDARSDADAERELARASERNARMIAAASAADSGELLMAQRMLDGTPEKSADWEWRHLALRVDSSERVLADVGSTILAATLVDEPPALVVACADGAVRWLDLASGAVQRELRVRTGAATALALAPQADRCFVGRSDGAIEAFTLAGERLAEGPSSMDAVAVLACSHDARLVISGHGERERRYRGWLHERGALFPLWTREGRAHAVTFVPQTRLALIAGQTPKLRGDSVTLIDGLSSAWIGRCGYQGERLYDLELSPDGERLAVLSWDGTLTLRRLYESTPLWSVEHKGPEGRPFPGTAVAFERGGERLASGGWDRSLHLWDARTGAHLAQRFGHRDRITFVSFSSPGRVLTASLDGTVREWDLASETALRRTRHPHWILGLDYSPDGQRLATGCRDGLLRVFDRRSGANLSTAAEQHLKGCYSVAWSPDGRWLATADTHYPPEYGEISGFHVHDATTYARVSSFVAPSASVLELAFLDDSRTLALARHDGRIELRDALTGALRRSLEGHTHPRINSVDVSPDGRRLASAGFDGSVRIWDLASGNCERVFTAHRQPVRAARWSPDGRTIASCGADWDHTVRTSTLLWNPDSGVVERELIGHEMGVLEVAWSPDGARLASADENGRVRLWDTRSGECVLWIRDEQGWLGSLAWSLDGRDLATGGADGTLRVWSSRAVENSR
ncbi:MAG: hypothetical protein FJ298_09700 [Planctomycetes bacterium]|nr:hypothetical protein [Planctomycetota bacterium]